MHLILQLSIIYETLFKTFFETYLNTKYYSLFLTNKNIYLSKFHNYLSFQSTGRKTFQEETHVGPSITVNYEALLRSLMVRRIMEKISTQKALINRLKDDLHLKLKEIKMQSTCISIQR